VPDARKDPATRPQGQLPGTVRITGLIREVPAPAMFTPANDAARNLWYWPDIAAMTDAAYRDTPGATMTALPFWIDADAQPEPPGGLPKGGATRLDLPNRHLEYALTWYGLALTLIGVYLAFAAGRLKLFSGHR
jgi:surfeit locus 1 family protein